MTALSGTETGLVGTNVAELLTEGRRLHQAQQLVEAEAYYRRVLAVQPDHADALNLLGLVCFQSGRSDLAVELLGRAIERDSENAGYISNLGNMLYACGKFDAAVAAYRQAISKKPDFAAAHSNLGAALRKQGKPDEASVAYRQAVLLKPDFFEAHNSHGEVLSELGKHDEALNAYRKALSINPRDANVFNNLGVTLAKLGRLQSAIAAHRQAVSIKPDFAEAYFHLAGALRSEGNLEAAVDAYRRAIYIKPELVEAYNNLGGALNQLDRRDEAIAAYRQAINIRPTDSTTIYNLGLALTDQGKLDEALSAYRRAIAIKPEFTDARCNLGLLLTEQGKVDEARFVLEEALRFAPNSARTFRMLGYVKKFSLDDRHLAAMENLARDMENLSSDEQVNLHFALAKAYEDLGNYEGFFRHLHYGNPLKRKEIVYDEAATVALFERIRAVFTPQLVNNKGGRGHASPVPVFIIGMPRSGKTTVERILASHAHFHGAGELDDFRSAATSLILSNPNGVPGSFPELVRTLTDVQLTQLGGAYLEAIRAAAPGAERISNTTPGNVRFIGLIHLALPNARIIYVRRDPLEVCLFCFAMLFNRDAHGYSYDLGELGRYYLAHEALMAHWRRVLPESTMLEVTVDQLVGDDAERKTRELVAHCGLEWDEACLAAARAIEVRQSTYWSAITHLPAHANALRPLIEALEGGVAGSRGTEFAKGRATSATRFAAQTFDIKASAGMANVPDAPVLPRLLAEEPSQQKSRLASPRQILVDGIKAVAIYRGLVRIECEGTEPTNRERSSCMLLIPANQARSILGVLTQAVQELGTRSEGTSSARWTGAKTRN